MQSNQYPQGNQPQQPQQPYAGAQPYATPMQQGYAQGMPPTLPPQMQPRKPRRWPWIIALIAVFLFGYGIGTGTHSTSSNTASTTPVVSTSTTSVQPTTPPQPTAKPKGPTTLFTQSGNGELTTKAFTTSGAWTLQWSCTPAVGVPDAPLFISVLDSGGNDTFSGDISTSCKTGNTSGSSDESQTGQVKLHIISGIDWKITAVTT